ncbi:hypothetical protein [Pedobacter rhodius]|uniref:Uncharacterized protein n=1 Tax=Pedobacter rhodius TaxID=3004098 RepID=A0ABT4L2P5_9SPHI|nr:hypothetical protein [Pedobacter sp. SJ11]MCZ4224338.1 hypothetical protein [Pedobacter sp. SJ11]
MNKDNTNNLQAHSYLNFCKTFFELRTVENHLLLLEELMDLITNEHACSKKMIHADAYIIYQFYTELFELAFQFKQHLDKEHAHISICVNTSYLEYEKQRFTYTFQYLNQQELINPLLALSFLKEEIVTAYKSTLYEWMGQLLNHNTENCNGKIYFPLYHNTRKLIELSWLIYNRVLEHQAIDKPMAVRRFEDTCPLLLVRANQLDPYLEVESFFNGASLGYYKFELRCWFKTALTENMGVEKHGNLIYFHNQLIQLLHAGYLIVTNNIKYISTTHYSSTGETFKDWINDIKGQKIEEGNGIPGSYEVNVLSEAEIGNPLFYLKQILTLKRIEEIRYGLQEWIYCAFNGNSSIATMDAKYVFNLYEELEKILEMLFLLIAGEEAGKN